MGRFVYQARDPSTVDKRANQQAGNREGYIKDDFTTYAPKKGDNWIRILPATFEGAENYGLDIWIHFGVGPDEASVLCPDSNKDLERFGFKRSRCPLCEARVLAERTGDTKLADDLKPKRRVLVWIADQQEPGKGPLAWAAPWTVDREIAKISRDKRTGTVYIVEHPDDGYDVSFDKEGEKDRTSYTAFQLARSPTAVPDAWLDYIADHPLPTILIWRDYAEINEIYTGGVDDSAPPAGRRAPPPDDRAPPPRDRDYDRAPPRERSFDRRAEPPPDRDIPPPRDRDYDRAPPSRERDPESSQDRVTPGDRGGYYDPPPRRRDTAPPPAEPDRPSAGRTRLRQDDPPQDAAPPRRDREPEPRYAEPVPRHERAPEPPQERGNDRDAAAERDARERFPVRGDEPPRDDRAQPSGSSRAEELSRRFADRR